MSEISKLWGDDGRTKFDGLFETDNTWLNLHSQRILDVTEQWKKAIENLSEDEMVGNFK